MAEATIASAVVLPDPEDLPPSPKASLKRRQSSITSNDIKRPRLNTDVLDETNNDPTPSSASDRRPDRRKSGEAEERRRGQRLFGNLLGTLSQSSSSAAQRRRADIEKKQQAKLKQQAEQYDEQKRKKREELMVVRRREQRVYDKQSMHLRHSNLLAMAHFLQTKAEPILHYKPWDVRPEEDAKIKAQIEEAQATIDREVAEYQEQEEPEHKPPKDKEENNPIADEGTNETAKHSTEDQPVDTDMVGAETNIETAAEPPKDDVDVDVDVATNHDSPSVNHTVLQEEPEISKEQDDGGEEVVEDQEDTVIY